MILRLGSFNLASRVPWAISTLSLAVCVVVTMTLTLSCPSRSLAQTASFRSVDKNGDRVLDIEELEAAFGQAGAARLLSSLDQNGDQRITILELRYVENNGRPSGDEQDEKTGRQGDDDASDDDDDSDEEDGEDDADDGDDDD